MPTHGLENLLERQPGVAAVIAAATEKCEGEAKRLAEPVSRRFADAIDSAVGLDSRGVVGRVSANWWGSLFVEFGTAHQRPHAILRRALDSVRRIR